MNYDYIIFSLFSSFALISAIMVISLSNAVHSILFLIFLFCNVIGLLLLLGAEFLSLIFLVVYVGAIAVLFLFVIMMLNVKISNYFVMKYKIILPLGGLIIMILIFQFLITINGIFVPFKNNFFREWIIWAAECNFYTNIEILGSVLYTKYGFLFLLCSFILLVAMIGTIVLTMHQRIKIKKQDINFQLFRQSKKSIKFIDLRKI